ncbi:hypothetical protein PSYAR_12589 [Pseudomonas syringae pv. aceris str. M302273]|nr:hypothetical protein PSYAR_12589 [Pseudomonas syringae pv. aceris str. M302273]
MVLKKQKALKVEFMYLHIGQDTFITLIFLK